MSRRLALGFLVGWAGAGCSSSQAAPDAQAPETQPDFVYYRVSGAIITPAGIPKLLRIKPDGTATKPGLGNVPRHATLDAATMDDLRGKIAAAQFSSLSPTYLCDCGFVPLYGVAVLLDGSVYTAVSDKMPPTVTPAGLTTVLDTLEQIYDNVAIWY